MNRHRTAAFAGAGMLLDTDMRSQLRLAWRLLRDPRVSVLKLVLPALMALYILSPVDLIPDFLLGLGQSDDIGAVILMTMLVVRLLPKLAPGSVVNEHVREMSGLSPAPEAGAATGGRVMDARFTVRG